MVINNNIETSLALDKTSIILISVGSIAFIALIAFLLFKFVFRKNRLRRQIRDLDRRFQYLHSLLIGQDAQYIKRLEIISRSNLLYVEIHTRFLKRFKEARDKHDAHAQGTINQLKDLSDEKKYKMLKEALVDAKDVIADYENEINTLNKDLLEVVKPEEECRQNALVLQEKLRTIKQNYYSKQSDLQMMSASFEEIFHYIDTLFKEFDELIERAQYDDANLILPKIEKIINEVNKCMGELPNLCAMVVTYIPEKISSLENAYEVMQQEDYPLHHLCVITSIRDMKSSLDYLTVRIKRFDINGVGSDLEDMAMRIEEFFNLFEEEKAARKEFEERNEQTYQTVNVIERRFIKLCNIIPEVSSIYIINEEHISMKNAIQNGINKLGALKRSLDTFIHSSTKQPYSLLVTKMKEIEESSKTVLASLDEFDKYLVSLRNDCEKAYALLSDYYFNVKNNEKTLKEIDVENIYNKYKDKIDRFYELLALVNKLLLVSPIDVDKVNEAVNELQQINNELFDNGAISEDYNMMLLAENGILYANRDRHRLSDMDDLTKQAENLFAKGEFEQSYIVIGNALKKMESMQDNAKK